MRKEVERMRKMMKGRKVGNSNNYMGVFIRKKKYHVKDERVREVHFSCINSKTKLKLIFINYLYNYIVLLDMHPYKLRNNRVIIL